jgi:hypothetical protein
MEIPSFSSIISKFDEGTNINTEEVAYRGTACPRLLLNLNWVSQTFPPEKPINIRWLAIILIDEL